MRLIDADSLKEKLCILGEHRIERLVEKEPTVDVLEQIRDEIRQTVDEEQKHDGKWAIGLRYALKIIDTYMKGE